jgi:signal peptidase I
MLAAMIVLRLCGLIRPFSVPTGAMTPAVCPNDHVMMESVTYLFRPPRRGDIVVFKTDGISSIPQGQFYLKRVAGEPGDHLRISAGKLFINDKQMFLSNVLGTIIYDPPPNAEWLIRQSNVDVPKNCYFVIGDNSTNSFDSRSWGSLPRGNILGRILFCYWPLRRFGRVE